MQVPASGFIEIAQQQLNKMTGDFLADQRRELLDAIPTASPAFSNGYALGLQTARVILETSTALAIKGVKAEDVL